jgi:hypothetical protein
MEVQQFPEVLDLIRCRILKVKPEELVSLQVAGDVAELGATQAQRMPIHERRLAALPASTNERQRDHARPERKRRQPTILRRDAFSAAPSPPTAVTTR